MERERDKIEKDKRKNFEIYKLRRYRENNLVAYHGYIIIWLIRIPYAHVKQEISISPTHLFT